MLESCVEYRRGGCWFDEIGEWVRVGLILVHSLL